MNIQDDMPVNWCVIAPPGFGVLRCFVVATSS